MHKIEISDEVWGHLTRLHIPFKDQTPNDVLRRVLPGISEARGPIVRSKPGVAVHGGEAALSANERGSRARADYISTLQQEGIIIRLEGSVWAYLEKSDSWAVIPFATEQLPNRWFLGAPEEDIAKRERVSIVLLCREESGTIFDIVLAPDLVTKIVPDLSRSKGQLKFNLKRVGSRYQLMIPRHGALDVSSCVRARSPLKK